MYKPLILFWQETLHFRTLCRQTCLPGFCHHKHSLAYCAFALPSLLLAEFSSSVVFNNQQTIHSAYIMDYYSAIKQKKNNAICSTMNGTRDTRTKRSKSGGERKIPCDITISGIQDIDEPVNRRETNSWLEEHSCGCQWRGRGSRIDEEVRVGECKLLDFSG